MSIEQVREMQPSEPFQEGLRHEGGFIKSADGNRLFWQGLEPRGEAYASVALVHGYNSASHFLLPMMENLAAQGMACYAVDYRGHGLSEGLPRHVFQFSDYLADVQALCDLVAERSGDRQIFLFGNSLGGLIVSLYGLRHPERLRGTVLTAPFFGPAFRIPRVLDLCARAASLLHPTFCLPRQREDQPGRVTLRWWTETLAAQQAWRRQAEKFTLPVLILHGQEDAVSCPSTAYSLFQRLGSRDKIFGIYPGARHQDLDPCQGPRWWSKVGQWVRRRAESSVARRAA